MKGCFKYRFTLKSACDWEDNGQFCVPLFNSFWLIYSQFIGSWTTKIIQGCESQYKPVRCWGIQVEDQGKKTRLGELLGKKCRWEETLIYILPYSCKRLQNWHLETNDYSPVWSELLRRREVVPAAELCRFTPRTLWPECWILNSKRSVWSTGNSSYKNSQKLLKSLCMIHEYSFLKVIHIYFC